MSQWKKLSWYSLLKLKENTKSFRISSNKGNIRNLYDLNWRAYLPLVASLKVWNFKQAKIKVQKNRKRFQFYYMMPDG